MGSAVKRVVEAVVTGGTSETIGRPAKKAKDILAPDLPALTPPGQPELDQIGQQEISLAAQRARDEEKRRREAERRATSTLKTGPRGVQTEALTTTEGILTGL